MATHLTAYKLSVFFILVLIFNSFLSCKSDQDFILEGDMQDSGSFLEGKKLYLGNEDTRNFEDSAVVTKGRFRFSVKPKNKDQTYPVSIVYATGNPAYPYQLVGYSNPILKDHIESNFYAESGKVTLQRVKPYKDMRNKEELRMRFTELNKQTDVAFRHLMFKSNPKSAEKLHEFNRNLIRKYSFSAELLDILERNKSRFPEKDVQNLLCLFDESLRGNADYVSIINFLSFSNNSGSRFPKDIRVMKPDKEFTSNILDKKSKYNLVVFWASWCGPCRMEIPQIKKLYEKHGDKLKIISISVDKREDWWQKALEKEKMPWNQYRIERDTSFTKLDKKYNLQTIPVWVLLDSNNEPVDQQIGLNNGENSIDQRVASHLGK